ncbi:diguanylate cyclase [Parafrankia sp. EAN1pec]|uniref:putative bifunctional diguanylate cyclase/phosphodiesterase n=1 Tax=Parafrankia sp. (strain EAN1pec) TaxID=298653 RepID=UPI00268CC87D
MTYASSRYAMTTGRLLHLRYAAPICVAYTLVAMVCALVFPLDVSAGIAAFAAALACLAVVVGLAWTGWRARGADRRWRMIFGLATGPTAVVATWHALWAAEHGSAIPHQFPWAAGAFLLIIGLNLAGVLAFPTDPLDAGDSAFAVARDGYHWYVITALDSLVVVGSMFLLAWWTVLEPIIRMRHPSAVGVVLNTGVVAGYWILLTAALLLSTFRQPRSGLALALLSAGVSVMILTTTIDLIVGASGGHGIPPIVDVVSAAGWLLVLLACLVPIPESPVLVRRGGSPRTLRTRAALPYLGLGAAGAVVVGQVIVNSPIDRVERIVLIGLLLVVLGRQIMTLGENGRLLASVQTSRRQLHHQAFHDPLTGLANRALFDDRLRHALASCSSRPCALVYCDLDDFKRVNDTLGHAVGDALLRITAARLRNGVRSGDTVARLGGDEFAILLEDRHNGPEPEAICRRLAAMIRAPALLAGRSYPVGASIGLVVANANSAPTADALLRDADIAMYAAKRQGKGGLVVYRPDLSTPESAPQTRADLEHALRGDERYGTVKIRYGPVVDLRTGDTSALDAEPHWNHRDLGEVAPDLLSRLANEAGLTLPLVGFVLREVCRDLAAQGPGSVTAPVFVSVPMSRDLQETPVVDIVGLLADRGLSRRAIILALADAYGIPDLTDAATALRRVADGGVPLALDGVGGHASTFAAWHTLPIQIIRLDRSLTDLDTGQAHQRTRQVRDAIIGVAAQLNLTVVATGINTPIQARELARAGCHLGTGPLYDPSRPLGKASC